MIKAYKLKLYPNKQKSKELNNIISYWRDQVNRKISIFWELKEMRGYYPPREFSRGSIIIDRSSIKAWEISKTAKRYKMPKPIFKKSTMELHQNLSYIIDNFQTKEFDIWFNITSLTKRKRLKIPAKRTVIFNQALQSGILRKTFLLKKTGKDFYIILFVQFEDKIISTDKHIGIDVGLNNAIATSDGKILGKEIKSLRIKTKWRNYKNKLSPTKQALNYYAKKLIRLYPNTDFVVEQLLFKGKKNRTKRFRRNTKNWAYNHLANRLESLGKLEGFRLIKVNPAYSSQSCPMCRFTDKANRQGEVFLCIQCGYTENADYVGAKNIAERVTENNPNLNRHSIR